MAAPERYDDVVNKFRPLDAYERGWVDGLESRAHWKDGRMYVGTTGETLAAAVRKFLEERRREERAFPEFEQLDRRSANELRQAADRAWARGDKEASEVLHAEARRREQ